MASSGGGDSLSSLLTDLGGVEGSIFSRPKTLDGMKKATPSPNKHINATSTTSKHPVQNASTRPSPSEATTRSATESSVYSNNNHSIEHLETLLQQKTTPPVVEDISHATTTHTNDNTLDWSFVDSSSATTTMTTANQATTIIQDHSDPFFDFNHTNTTTTTNTTTATTTKSTITEPSINNNNINEDPLEMFGGTPAPSSIHNNKQQQHSNDTGDTGDTNEDFTHAFEEIDINKNSNSNNNNNNNDDDDDGMKQQYSSHTINTTNNNTTNNNTTNINNDDDDTERVSSTSHGLRKILSEEQSRHSHYKAFDYLDAREAQLHDNNNSINSINTTMNNNNNPVLSTSSTNTHTTSSPLDWNPQHAQHGSNKLHNNASETISDISHKAAKAFQFGKKWIMQASKHLADNVQATIEKHRHNSTTTNTTHSFYSDDADDGYYNGHGYSGDTTTTRRQQQQQQSIPTFYYDWASQLSRMSPGSKVAALGAMDEDDRLTVQRILDESELGERVVNLTDSNSNIDIHGHGGNNNNSSIDSITINRKEEKKADDAPPGYDDLMMNEKKETQQYTTKTPSSSSLSSMHTTTDRDEQHKQNIQSSSASLHQQQQQPPSEDLLGIHHHNHNQDTTTTTNTIIDNEDVDLLGGDDDDNDDTVNTTTEHIDDMFTVKTHQSTHKPPSSSSRSTAVKTSTTVQSATTTAMDAMIDLGSSSTTTTTTTTTHVDVSQYKELYADGDSSAASGADDDEPEMRKILRQNRIAEKHERMMKQLAEKRAREEQEEAEKAGKVAFRETLKPRIETWTSGKKDNIRALLSTLHTVLWDGSGWTQPSIADMVEASKVKKWYMKANLVVHPDKVKQKGGSVEQVATADMVFDVLKSAWGKFEEKELR